MCAPVVETDVLGLLPAGFLRWHARHDCADWACKHSSHGYQQGGHQHPKSFPPPLQLKSYCHII